MSRGSVPGGFYAFVMPPENDFQLVDDLDRRPALDHMCAHQIGGLVQQGVLVEHREGAAQAPDRCNDALRLRARYVGGLKDIRRRRGPPGFTILRRKRDEINAEMLVAA